MKSIVGRFGLLLLCAAPLAAQDIDRTVLPVPEPPRPSITEEGRIRTVTVELK